MKWVLGSVLFALSAKGLAAHAVLLVSLGLPDKVLVAYLQQAAHYRIPLLLRGLYRTHPVAGDDPALGSWPDTSARLAALLKQSTVGGVSIDPLFFRAFAVNAVPALVVYESGLACLLHSKAATGRPCASSHYDVVYGNIPLGKQLRLIARQSRSPARAGFARARLAQDRPHGEGV